MIGIIAGTYSSIFLVGPFWYMLSNKPELAVASGAVGKQAASEVKDEKVEVKQAAGAENVSEGQSPAHKRKKKRK